MRGEHDLATRDRLAKLVNGLIETDDLVVIDLSAVTFLDSSALNALVQAQRSLAEREIAFRVVSPRDQLVRRVLEITKLAAQLRVVESLDDALA